MPATVFNKEEDKYQQWLKNNPEGYVLTTVRNIAPSYMVLHRTSCNKISQYTKKMANDAFTGQRYIKICSRSSNALVEWIKAHGGDGFTKLCSRCAPNPDEGLVDGIESYYSRLDAEVSRSLGDSKARKARLKVASKIPESFSTTTTTIFRRSRSFRTCQWVLRKVSGYSTIQTSSQWFSISRSTSCSTPCRRRRRFYRECHSLVSQLSSRTSFWKITLATLRIGRLNRRDALRFPNADWFS